MPDQAYIRSAIAMAAVQLLPPTIRAGLISDPSFRDEFGLASEAIVTLGASGADFQRSTLFEAVASALGGAQDASVEDKAGRSWRIEYTSAAERPTVRLSQGSLNLVGNHLVLLSPDKDTRLNILRAEANRVNLPAASLDRWQALLESRPPADDELVELLDDINNTPTARQAAIAEHLSRGRASLELVVPRSAEYFERLIGRHEDGQSLEDFIVGVAVPHIQALVAWKPFEGYQLALALASHGSVAAALGTLAIDDPVLIRVHNWLAESGDPMSRAAEIEASLKRVKSAPELKDSLERVITAFILGPGDAENDAYKVFSALIKLVDGELAATRLFPNKPPYWRRMAAIAQAVIILRAGLSVGEISTDFVRWAHNARSQLFALQSFVDMRLEPRWIPEFVAPRQLWNEFGGRVLTAANMQSGAVAEMGWADKLEREGELEKRIDIPQAFMAGPLEGGTPAFRELDAENIEKIRAELAQPTITGDSFMSLANATALARAPEELCNLAADAFARTDYHIEGLDADVPLIALLLALATSASATRSHRLADALFIALRVYRRHYADELEPEAAFRIAMIASASRTDLPEWCKCVGSGMNDLAFQTITEEQAARLHSQIVHLCHLVPELWATCGQAEAALRAVAKA